MQYELIKDNIDDIVAVGEIGLDYYWIKDPREREIEQKNFIKLLELAKQHDKPVLIHSRNAEKAALDILKKQGIEKATMHCFSGSQEDAMRAIDMGYPISIPTNISRSKQKQDFAKEFPLESIVLETDAPYLAPEPKTVNEPMNVIKTAQTIAELRGIEIEEVSKATTKNARDFFSI
jgi:TatD DNase family protein